jgi:hypothetical protein
MDVKVWWRCSACKIVFRSSSRTELIDDVVVDDDVASFSALDVVELSK